VTLPTLVRFHLRRYRLLFVAMLALLFLHDVAFLYIFKFWQRQVELADMFLSIIPGRVRDGMGIPLADLRDPATFKALVLLRPDLRALTLAFGVTVGTDVVAGEIGRGTSDLLYSHPVRRSTAVLALAIVVALHLLCAGFVMIAGFLAITRIAPMGPTQPGIAELLPSVGNVVLASLSVSMFALLAGTLFRTRAPAVGASLLLILVPMVLDFMGLFTTRFAQIARAFPEHYYRPHVLLIGAEGPTFLECAAPLVLLGGAALAAAVFVACRRDLS